MRTLCLLLLLLTTLIVAGCRVPPRVHQYENDQHAVVQVAESALKEQSKQRMSAVDKKIMQMSGELDEPRDHMVRPTQAISIETQTDEVQVNHTTQSAALTPSQAVALALQAAQIDEIACREKQAIENAYRPITKRHYCSLINTAKCLIDLAAKAEKENHALRVLEAYYALAEVHAQLQLLDESQSLLDRRSKQIEEARRADMSIEMSRAELDRHQLALAQKRSTLETARSSLAAQLVALLGVEADRSPFIWTNANLASAETSPELIVETETALSSRTDLKVLYTIQSSCEKDVARLAEVSLGQTSPFFGSLSGPQPEQSLLDRILVQDETEILRTSQRQQQIGSLIQGLNIKIRAEVANDVFAILNHVNQIDIHRQIIETYQNEISQQKELRRIGRGSFVELVEAEFDELQAQSALFHSAYELQIARVRLQKTRGTLLEDLGINSAVLEEDIYQPFSVADQYWIQP